MFATLKIHSHFQRSRAGREYLMIAVQWMNWKFRCQLPFNIFTMCCQMYFIMRDESLNSRNKQNFESLFLFFFFTTFNSFNWSTNIFGVWGYKWLKLQVRHVIWIWKGVIHEKNVECYFFLVLWGLWETSSAGKWNIWRC